MKIEDPEWREQAYKHALDLEGQHCKSRLFLSMRRKRLRIQREENKHKTCHQSQKIELSSQDLLVQRRGNIWRFWEKRTSTQIVSSTPKTKLISKHQGFQDEDRIRGLCICSFVTNIIDCTQILWNSMQISFIHIFKITQCLYLDIKCVISLLKPSLYSYREIRVATIKVALVLSALPN